MGYYFHSLGKREEAKSEFEQKLSSLISDTDCIRFQWNEISNKIHWEENGKEFWLNNKLYDVVKQKHVNGKSYLYCLADEKEEQIVHKQVELTKGNANYPAKNSKTSRFNIPDFILANDEADVCASIYVPATLCYYHTQEMLQYYDPTSPPPQA